MMTKGLGLQGELWSLVRRLWDSGPGRLKYCLRTSVFCVVLLYGLTLGTFRTAFHIVLTTKGRATALCG